MKEILLIFFIKQKSIMQVISSRSNQKEISVQNQKSRKRGLSLTSKSKCNSLPKPSQQLVSAQTLESSQLNTKQTQNPIRLSFQNYHQPSSYFSENQNHTSSLISTQRSSIQKPKITFRYSNELGQQQNQVLYNRRNPFLKNDDQPLNPKQIRERLLPSQHLRSVVVTKSIEKKIPSQIQSLTEKNSNVNKIMIDSRRIQRDIIEQEVYQPFSTVKQNTPQSTSNLTSILNRLQEKQESQITLKNKSYLQLSRSPYNLLVSSAKKCQSKEHSPLLIQQKLKNDTFTQKALPHIKQFQFDSVVIEEYQQDSPSTSRAFENNFKTENRPLLNKKQNTFFETVVIESQQPYVEEITLIKTEPLVKSQDSKNILQLHPCNKIEENENFSDKKVIKTSPQKVKLISKQQDSPKKIVKNTSPKKILAEIENRPPQVNTNQSSLSSRRNIKRFKEIEKRLQQIITICGKNL